MTIITRRQERLGTAAAWTAANPILASGEWGYESDTGRAKIGDGVTAWTALPYSAGPLDADLATIGGLDSATAGVLASDGGGWLRKTYAQLKASLLLAKGDVGLGSVDNTSDAGKPVSTAQQAALNAKLAANDPSVTNARTPTGGAGGVLGGSYPNPGFAVPMSTQAALDAEATTRGAADTARVLKAGDTMTGPLVLPGDATTALQALPRQQLDAARTADAAAQSATYGRIPTPGTLAARPSTPAKGDAYLATDTAGGTLYEALTAGAWTQVAAGVGGGGGSAIPRVYDLITDFGAVRYDTLAAAQAGTDSTSAFKTAIATCAAAGGGRIVCAPGFYRISGALDPAGNGNAQIPLPVLSGSTDPYVAIELWCPQPAGAAPWYTGTAGGRHGAILVSNLAASAYTTAKGMPSVIGGPTLEAQGFAWDNVTYFVQQFTSLHIALRGIAVTQAGNPTRTAFDLGLVASCAVDDCRAQQDAAPTNVQPTNAHAWGLVMPRGYNHVLNDVRLFHVQGYYAGMSFDEHCTADSISIVACEVGLVPTGYDKHPAGLKFINSEWCHYDIAKVNPSAGVYDGTFNGARSWFAIDCLNIEDKPALAAGSWNDKSTGANIYDPFHNLRASIGRARYVVSQGYDAGPAKITGGNGVVLKEFTSGAQSAPVLSVSTTTADSATTVPARSSSIAEVGGSAISNVRSLAAVQAAGTWGISGNKIYRVAETPNAGGHGASVVWDWFQADGTLSCPITMSSGITYARLIMHAVDKNNYIALQTYKNGAGASSLRLVKVVAGVESVLLSGPAGEFALSATYVFSLTLDGRGATAKIDGVTKITGTNVLTVPTRATLVCPLHGVGSSPGSSLDDGATRFGDVTFTPKLG